MASEKMLVGRHKRVAFMDADGSGKTFTRMTGFTSLSDGKNSTEYSRQYVDEASERSDVVGYAPAIDYEFDRYTNDPVHEKIAAITDDEILGTEAQVDIVVVDLFEQKTSETTCTARKRTWSVIPDTEGDGTDALIYKGSFKAAGEITKGTATTTDGWKTCMASRRERTLERDLYRGKLGIDGLHPQRNDLKFVRIRRTPKFPTPNSSFKKGVTI